MGNQLCDGKKVVLTVFVVVLAGRVTGLCFSDTSSLEIEDSTSELQLSTVKVQQNTTRLREDVVRFRAELPERFHMTGGRMSAIGTAIETHHWSQPRPTN